MTPLMTQHTKPFSNMAEFDALAQSISAKLGCDASMISVINSEALIALGHSGSANTEVQRTFPSRDTICARTVRAGRPLRICDAISDPELRNIPAVADLRIGAYLGVPLVLDERGIVGAVCVVSQSARIWRDSEVDYLIAVSDLVESKIERHLLRYEQKALSAALAENDAILAMLSEVKCKALTVHNAAGDMVFSSAAMHTDLRLNTEEMLALPKVARQLNFDAAGTAPMRVALPVAQQTALNVNVFSNENGLTLAEWSRRGS